MITVRSSPTNQIISPTDASWQQFLNTIPYDFYHLPGYLELEAARYNATAEAIIIKDEDRVFFLPYLIRDCHQILEESNFEKEQIYDVISPYGYPGMLVSEAGQNPQFINQCLNLIHDRWQEKNICSAFIRLHPILNSYLNNLINDSDRLIAVNQGNVVICDLTRDINEIWRQTRANHRTKTNKLRRSGFNVSMVSIDKYIDVFIDIYRETMDRVNASKAYYFTREYFENLADTLGSRLHLCIVEIAGEIVAASLIAESSGIVQYHLGGTRTKYLPQSPTTIMFNYIIKWAKQRNNRYLNLGGGLGGSKDSLYHFKSGFSKQTKPFMTIKTIVNEDLYRHLTQLRAKSLGITTTKIESASFFPAYRSG